MKNALFSSLSAEKSHKDYMRFSYLRRYAIQVAIIAIVIHTSYDRIQCDEQP